MNTFYMPAEMVQHERTFMEWPVKESMVWPNMYENVCQGYAQVANAILEFEPVTMIVNQDSYEYAKALCNEQVELLTIPHNDAWCRDNGPTFIIDKKGNRAGINWQFNAWGGKYGAFDLDNQVAGQILEHFYVKKIDSSIVLEGGSIHSDGEGTLLTTKECLLNPNRNPNLTQEEIELEIRNKLSVSTIIWLNKGLFGDETDGHVDNIACFGKPGTVIIQTCKEADDPNYEITMENLEILKNTKDAKGRSLRIVELPQPPARYFEQERLTLSYLNFYFVNGGIILPLFGDDATETDNQAINILQKEFPEYKIVGVDGMALITEGGNVHCITQQMPMPSIA